MIAVAREPSRKEKETIVSLLVQFDLLADMAGFDLAAVIITKHKENEMVGVTAWSPTWKQEFQNGCEDCETNAVRLCHQLLDHIQKAKAGE